MVRKNWKNISTNTIKQVGFKKKTATFSANWNVTVFKFALSKV